MKESINWKSKKDVLKSVQQDGRTLQYASEDFRNDKEIVLAAVQKYVGAVI